METPDRYALLREALGSELMCRECAVEFYVYRSDVHHASDEAPVKYCPFCGGAVEVA